MPISAGLQKYFDSQKKKKGDMEDSFAKLKKQIDPAFLQSFEIFHDKLMWIVEEHPESTEIITDELVELNTNIQHTQRKHNMKKAAAIIDVAA